MEIKNKLQVVLSAVLITALIALLLAATMANLEFLNKIDPLPWTQILLFGLALVMMVFLIEICLPAVSLTATVAVRVSLSLLWFILLAILVPYGIYWALTKVFPYHPAPEWKIFSLLLLQSVIVTFHGKDIMRDAWYDFLDNSSKAAAMCQKLASTDFMKFYYFLFYFVLLLFSAFLKFEHKKVFGLSEGLMTPVIQAFAVYVALDRVSNSFKKIRK